MEETVFRKMLAIKMHVYLFIINCLFQARVYLDASFYCAATIVSERWVVTSADCTAE